MRRSSYVAVLAGAGIPDGADDGRILEKPSTDQLRTLSHSVSNRSRLGNLPWICTLRSARIAGFEVILAKVRGSLKELYALIFKGPVKS